MSTSTPFIEGSSRVGWYMVGHERDAYSVAWLADGRISERAALLLARRASETYPDDVVTVFKGRKRGALGQFVCRYRNGTREVQS